MIGPGGCREAEVQHSGTYPLQIANRHSKITNSHGVLAQLVERLNGIEEVRGSIPLGSTESPFVRRCAESAPTTPSSTRHSDFALVRAVNRHLRPVLFDRSRSSRSITQLCGRLAQFLETAATDQLLNGRWRLQPSPSSEMNWGRPDERWVP